MLTAVFLDGNNLYFTSKKYHDNRRIDYQKLYDFINTEENQIFQCAYYGVSRAGETQRFHQALQSIGYTTRSKTKKDNTWPSWSIEMTHDIHLAAQKADKIILCTNDWNWIPVLDYLKTKVKVELIGVKLSPRLIGAAHKATELSLDFCEENYSDT